MSQLTDNLNTIASIKGDIRDAIEAKGVNMSGVAFSGFASKIGEIQTGGGQKPEDSLAETITGNGTFNFAPQSGHVFSDASITVSVHPSASLSETYTSNSTYTVSGEFNGATITVSVPGGQKTEEVLTETITSNGSYSFSPTQGNVFSSASIDVSVHPSTSLSATYTSNGTYAVSGEFNGGQVIVSVSSLDPVPAANEIYYKSYSGEIITPYNSNNFGAVLQSNTKVGNGWCLLTFDRPVVRTGQKSFYMKYDLKEMILPYGITTISIQSFDITMLQRIVIPDTVTVIDAYAFSQCPCLISRLRLPTSLTKIYEGAFDECTALTAITIPAGVTELLNGCFGDCTHLMSVTVLATTPPELGNDYVFSKNFSSRVFYVPAESLQAYKTAPRWSNYASSIMAIPS